MIYELGVDGSFAKADQILPFFNDIFLIFFICINIMFVFITRCFLKTSDYDYVLLFKFYKKFKAYFFIFFILLILSDYAISKSNNFKFSDPMILATINTKFALYFFVFCNFLYIYPKMKEAKTFFIQNDTEEAKETLTIISQYFGLLNIAILIFIVYLKVVIGEFR